MGRSVRRAAAPNHGDTEAATSGASMLVALLRKLEQTDFVNEERWSTLQSILSGVTQRINAINRKVDAIIEWHLSCQQTGAVESLVLLDSLPTGDEAGDVEKSEPGPNGLIHDVANEAMLVAESPRAELGKGFMCIDETVSVGKVESVPSSAPRATDETLDWNWHREQLMREYADDDARAKDLVSCDLGQHCKDADSRSPATTSRTGKRASPPPVETAATARSLPESPPASSAALPVDDLLEVEPDHDTTTAVMPSSATVDLSLGAQVPALDESSATPDQNAAQSLNEIELLREQLVQVIRQSELELSIMRAQMAQERARLEQMEAEIKQREKNLQRRAGGDKDRQSSRLKSFLRPNEDAT